MWLTHFGPSLEDPSSHLGDATSVFPGTDDALHVSPFCVFLPVALAPKKGKPVKTDHLGLLRDKAYNPCRRDPREKQEENDHGHTDGHHPVLEGDPASVWPLKREGCCKRGYGPLRKAAPTNEGCSSFASTEYVADPREALAILVGLG